jgi:RimJ/RimL family protein N-acetyltransferase
MVDVRLEPLSEAHVEPLAQMLTDPDVLRFSRVPVPVPLGFGREWFQRYADGRRDGTRVGFAIVDETTDEFLGVALAPTIDEETRTVELGYLVASNARGRGVATAALRRLTDWAFRELGALRIELVISVHNPASKRVAERCGYTLEGVHRSVYFKQGLREDIEIWARLPDDPDVS